ncbi:MAG: O-antigen ligase family protein [Phycisphaerae bacterium]
METVRKHLSAVLWVLLLVVLGVASTSSIRWVSPAVHIESSFGPSRDLTCAVILGLLILVAGTLAPKTQKYSWSSCLKFSVVLLVVGISISSFLASDKILAFYAGSGLLIGLVLMFTTCRLADQPWKIHLALVVVTSLGVTFAAKTWMRERVEIDQTLQQYQETKTEFWAKQGKSLDDPSVKLFEERMASRDNGGFFFHGNLGGMYLGCVFFVSLALVAKRWCERHLPYGRLWLAGSILLTLFILSALILTQSKGAILSVMLGIFLLAVIWLARDKMIRHFRSAVLAVTLLLILTAAAIIGYGLTKKTLPTLSMAYRWQYWTAGFHMFMDHPLTGVGLNNFGHYYLRYKLPQAEEEITSPHNFIVEGFTELGLIGGLGLTLLPLAIFYQLAKNSKLETRNPKLESSPPPSAPLLLLITWVGTFALLFIFNQSGLPGPVYLVAEYLPYMIAFALAFVLCTLKSDRFESIDNSAPNSLMVLCLTSSLIVFILGDLVNFSLEEPSMQFLFFFLAGLTLAATRLPMENKPKFDLQNLTCMIGLFIYLFFLVIPAIKFENAAVLAETSSPASDPSFDSVYQKFSALTDKYSYDAHLPAQAGKRLIQIAQTHPQPVSVLEQAAQCFAQAAQKANAVWEFRSRQAQCELMLAKVESDKRLIHFAKAEDLFEQARNLAPRSKSLALTLGLLYVQHVQDLPADQKNERTRLSVLARKNLNDALNLNQALPAYSHRHLTNQQIDDAQTALKCVKP